MDKILKNNAWYAVFAALFSLMIVFGRHVFDESGDKGTVLNVYFTDLDIKDLLIWLLVGAAVFLAFKFIPKLKREWVFGEKRTGRRDRKSVV